MKSLRLNKSLDLEVVNTTNGLKSLKLISYPETNSQLVPLRVFSVKKNKEFEPKDAIEWQLFLGETYSQIQESLIPILATQLRTLIKNTIGVDEVDIEEGQISVNPFRINHVCFKINCKNYTL